MGEFDLGCFGPTAAEEKILAVLFVGPCVPVWAPLELSSDLALI